MSQEKNSMPGEKSLLRQTSFSSGNEIELFDLINQIWAGKKIILLSIIFTVFIAGLYVFLVEEKWVSTAIVTQPGSGDIADYNVAMNALAAMSPQDKIGAGELRNQLFVRFSASMSAMSRSLQNLEEPLNLEVKQTIAGRDDPLNISFTASSAKKAQEELTRYIKEINDDVVDTYTAGIKYNLKIKEQEFTQSLTYQEHIAKEKQDKRTAVIKQALKVAQDSNIHDFQLQQAEFLSDDTLYLLGTKSLLAMVENEETRPLVFPDYYYNTQRALMTITNLKISIDNLRSFRFIMQPDLPIRRESPRRGLTLILSVFLGGVIGCGIVLGRNMYRDYRQRQQQQ